jgi:hypothetical protein
MSVPYVNKFQIFYEFYLQSKILERSILTEATFENAVEVVYNYIKENMQTFLKNKEISIKEVLKEYFLKQPDTNYNRKILKSLNSNEKVMVYLDKKDIIANASNYDDYWDIGKPLYNAHVNSNFHYSLKKVIEHEVTHIISYLEVGIKKNVDEDKRIWKQHEKMHKEYFGDKGHFEKFSDFFKPSEWRIQPLAHLLDTVEVEEKIKNVKIWLKKNNYPLITSWKKLARIMDGEKESGKFFYGDSVAMIPLKKYYPQLYQKFRARLIKRFASEGILKYTMKALEINEQK